MSDPFRKLRLTPAEECAPGTPALPRNLRRNFRPHDARRCADQLHAAEACPAAASPTAAVTPLGALLARHIVRDGEVVLLVLKPSFWFILLSSLRFIATVAIFAMGAITLEGRYNREWFYLEAAIFLVAGRIMFSVLQWMGRMNVLTDMRVIRLSGVFKLEIFDCALRKVARTQITTSLKERLCGTGSIEIIPAADPHDAAPAAGTWQTIRRPREVHDLIVSTINKAKHHGYNAGAAA
jgi:hypothetical protein